MFVAESVTQAMHAVRREMGDQAVIIQVRRRSGSEELVEVIAANGEEIPAVAEVIASPRSGQDCRNKVALLIGDLFSEELQSRLLSGAEAIIDAEPTLEANEVMAQLCAREVLTFDLLSPDNVPLPVLLLGPAGMGKTSVVMKLATQCCLEGQAVRMMNLDSKRVGNRYTLSNFSRLSGVKAHHMGLEGAIRKIVQSGDTDDYLFIDTPPLNVSDRGLSADFLESFADHPMYRILVVSSMCDQGYLGRLLYQCSQEVALDGIIVTSMDQHPDYRNLLEMLLESGLPLVGVSRSDEITARLDHCDGGQLWHDLQGKNRILPQ